MHSQVDPKHLVGPTLPVGEREVRAVTINTLFGGFGRAGTSGPLGNETDAALIGALRSWADVILVGSGTVQAEDYGPAHTPMAVLSTSLQLDTDLGIFHGSRLIVLAPERSLDDVSLEPNRHALRNAGAELMSSGGGSAPEIINALHEAGFARILCEGGPSVYADMLSADLVDVLHLTLDPSIGPEDGPFGLKLGGDQHPRRFAIEDATVDGTAMLFCRLRRVGERR
ncbi:dihydrofolate reductase family protein [Corynebacterium aquatimens]|uniref:dihydrofolate reductase family protein n=1 Tax=Corynebacterium TaxID=1716 RepID=UPI001F2FA6AE|nr:MULTISPECIES: dihydrofolate reductase family protein [Corynebacterium]QYH19643.1 dihydrofolate reductase family protein [Corynebacterium aquatimens]UIZ91362.1 dihydrofolate reductase family protein [Corynebacterium sp. CNCTC7651]